ncbi:UDP-glucose iridoid glucosyltransferase-like [Abrus precatorius]|uniref:UDP-glucose iridoid glucosyltransferase-like n=1 Tax=Abrus precatorius TaxID=3816 RepID=A0A8B8LKH3_ABRPR|nr:UDP-glucose iridoid glucosyltransferase-like [Abrus precatorius]
MENQRHRLVLIPPPFQGHLTPMLQLANTLQSKGFSITVAHAHFNSPDPSNHPNLLFLPLSYGLSDTHISSKNIVDISATLNTKCVSPLKEFLVDQIAKANISHEKIACVIYDGLMHSIDLVARELKLPSMVLRTTSATNVLTYYHAFVHLQRTGCLPFQDSKSLELVPELEPLRFKDLLIFKLTNSDVLQQQLVKTLAVRPSLGFIFNTVDCLEEQSLYQLRHVYKVRLFPIGPLHMIAEDSSSSSFVEEDYSCIAWLNNQARKSVLYVSLGSIASWDEKELTEVAWGLANSKQNFLWVIRPGTIDDVSEWLQSLPEDVTGAIAKKGCIVKWAPQGEVLAHQAVGGFWSHCGWNSTLESLSEGVPIICQPHFGDQGVNARLLSHVWKVGLEWSNIIERDEIESAVRRLMEDSEGKEMRQRALKLKNEIRLAVQGGSSYDALNGLVKSILSVNL